MVFSAQLLTNTALVSGGGEPPGFDGNNTATDIVAVADAASITGTVWTDTDHDRSLDGGEPLMAGWTVELLLNGSGASPRPRRTLAAPTVSRGWRPVVAIRFASVIRGPVSSLAMRRPTKPVPATAAVYRAPTTCATTTDGTLSGITLTAGQNLVAQSLPLDPSGVVYDAVTRAPVAGAVVTISGPGGFNPAAHLVSGSATTTTGTDGQYQFLLNPTAPAGVHTLTVTTYPAGYLPSISTLCGPLYRPLGGRNVLSPALVQDASSPPTSGEAATCPGLVGRGGCEQHPALLQLHLDTRHLGQ